MPLTGSKINSSAPSWSAAPVSIDHNFCTLIFLHGNKIEHPSMGKVVYSECLQINFWLFPTVAGSSQAEVWGWSTHGRIECKYEDRMLRYIIIYAACMDREVCFNRLYTQLPFSGTSLVCLKFLGNS